MSPGRFIKLRIVLNDSDTEITCKITLSYLIEVTLEKQPSEMINKIFEWLEAGDVSGRVVLDLQRN